MTDARPALATAPPSFRPPAHAGYGRETAASFFDCQTISRLYDLPSNGLPLFSYFLGYRHKMVNASGIQLDAIDMRLLALLQEDVTHTSQSLAAEVGLSNNACWRRIKTFEEKGVIRRRVALLDANLLNAATTVFVSIRTTEHSADWMEAFTKAAGEMPEVVELYRMAGDVDYLIKLKVADIAAYDRVYKELIKKMKMGDVSAAFAMEEIKNTTALPLRQV